ncbi:phage minor structural protein, N-terminal region [Bacillus mycoides]|uniref:phage tail spike protein n=1 Tax=Bacillus mycoides TaxID=1405 RepID=UPI0008E36433|nr:phage tail spike protein [Bacillus mycoides]SFQ77039.1 phage minor structural protein, N-terminal region [Bacillus mycoides]
MRTPSGILHVVDFKTSQIVSNIQPKDYRDDKRHWEIKNNIDTLEFKVFDNTDHAATLMQQNLVLKEVRDGRIVPYVITETEKNADDRSIIAYASGEWIQLAKTGIINPQKIEGKTVNEFIDMALVGTKWKRGKTEYAGFHTMTIDEFIDPLKFLKDIASLFELEIQYRAEVVGSQIVGRYVDMVKKRGRDTGKEVTLGKDLIGIKRIENSQNICTALLGFVKKEGGDFITISSINNGVPYLVDNDAFQRWNERGQHKFGFYTPETEQDITPQRLLTLMKTELAKRVNTSYSYDVQAQSIGRVFGLAHELINEGDTIRIKDTGFTPKLYLEARVIAGDESFTDPTQDKYVFGDYREIVNANEELRKMYNRILATLGSKANKELLDRLEQLVKENDQKTESAQKESEAAKLLAEKVQENLKNYQTAIIESKNPPTTGLEPGKTLWRDISNGKLGILKIWKGSDWEVLIPDYGKDVKDLDERTAKFETSMTGLTSDVKQLTITTTDQGKQILEANSKIEQTSQKIEGKVDIKQVEDYIGGIGPTNDIRNTRFTKGTKYWGLGAEFPAVVDTGTTHLGDSSMKLTVNGLTSPAYNSFTSNRIPVTPGEDVVVSAYFMTKNIDEHYNKKIRMVAVFWKSDGTQFSAGTYDFTIKNDTWTRQEFTKVAPPEAALVGLRAYVIQNGTFWMAHPMLQKGTKASSYIENPNDMVDKDKIMEDLADKVATEKYDKKVIELERSITANADGVSIISKKHETFVNDTFDAYVKQTGSKLQVLDEGILAEVKKGNIIAAINFSSEKLVIDVSKVNINADTMVKWLTAKGIDTNIINVNGDKITIDKNGVTVKMLDFLFQDEWGTKTTAVSRRNLIADSDFSSVGKKNIGNADYYGFEGGYGLSWKLQGNVVIEKNTSVFDYEQMINAARVDLYNYPEAVINNGIHPGNEYTVSAHFRASMINGVRKTAKPRLHVCCVKFKDNVSYDIWNEQKMDFPEPSIFYGEIRRYSFTFKVPTNYKPQEYALIIKVCSANGQISAGTAICVSGVTLYSGKYASMYNWDRAAAERAAGIQPFNSISVGGVNNNIGPAPDGQTFDVSTENEVKFFRSIRAVQGVNLGGNAYQGWGHILFRDGNLGPGFYVNTPNGWKFNALG